MYELIEAVCLGTPGFVKIDESEKKIFLFCKRYSDDKQRVNDMNGFRRIWLKQCLEQIDTSQTFIIDSFFYKKFEDIFLCLNLEKK